MDWKAPENGIRYTGEMDHRSLFEQRKCFNINIIGSEKCVSDAISGL